jgi:sulfatase modifying factor 1
MLLISGTGSDGFVDGSFGGRHVIRDMCFDTTEVSVSAYERCVASRRCMPVSTTTDSGISVQDGEAHCNMYGGERLYHPVNCVTHAQATAYCASVGKRLPSEWEWEWAARGRDEGRVYPYGAVAPNCTRVVMNEGGRGCAKNATWPVGSKVTGMSRDGLKDMAGNVSEWTSSALDAKSQIVQNYVVKGGAWINSDPRFFQNADRTAHHDRDISIGFRCVRAALD